MGLQQNYTYLLNALTTPVADESAVFTEIELILSAETEETVDATTLVNSYLSAARFFCSKHYSGWQLEAAKKFFGRTHDSVLNALPQLDFDLISSALRAQNICLDNNLSSPNRGLFDPWGYAFVKQLNNLTAENFLFTFESAIKSGIQSPSPILRHVKEKTLPLISQLKMPELLVLMEFYDKTGIIPPGKVIKATNDRLEELFIKESGHREIAQTFRHLAKLGIMPSEKLLDAMNKKAEEFLKSNSPEITLPWLSAILYSYACYGRQPPETLLAEIEKPLNTKLEETSPSSDEARYLGLLCWSYAVFFAANYRESTEDRPIVKKLVVETSKAIKANLSDIKAMSAFCLARTAFTRNETPEDKATAINDSATSRKNIKTKLEKDVEELLREVLGATKPNVRYTVENEVFLPLTLSKIDFRITLTDNPEITLYVQADGDRHYIYDIEKKPLGINGSTMLQNFIVERAGLPKAIMFERIGVKEKTDKATQVLDVVRKAIALQKYLARESACSLR